jgi:hypothetical protein
MPTAGGTERRIQRPNRPRNPPLWASQPDGIVVAPDGSIISSNLKEVRRMNPLGITVALIGSSIPLSTAGTMLALRNFGGWTPEDIVAAVGALVVAAIGVLIVAILKSEYQRPSRTLTTRPASEHLKDAA